MFNLTNIPKSSSLFIIEPQSIIKIIIKTIPQTDSLIILLLLDPLFPHNNLSVPKKSYSYLYSKLSKQIIKEKLTGNLFLLLVFCQIFLSQSPSPNLVYKIIHQLNV